MNVLHPGTRLPIRALGSGLLLFALGACGGRQAIPGECGSVHGAEICVWGESSGGEIVSFGATVPISAIEDAPAEAAMAWPPVANAVLELPEAVRNETGFHLLTVFWEAHGHPPGPYLTPHFDFHFYSITGEELQAIDCVDVSKPAAIPAGYTLPDVNIPEIGDLPGLCVPAMGMHSLPTEEMESQSPFEKTLVVGYYGGQSIFMEPMLTQASLLERQSFSLEVPTVPGQPSGVRYPTSFQAEYDEYAQAYRFVFSALEGD